MAEGGCKTAVGPRCTRTRTRSGSRLNREHVREREREKERERDARREVLVRCTSGIRGAKAKAGSIESRVHARTHSDSSTLYPSPPLFLSLSLSLYVHAQVYARVRRRRIGRRRQTTVPLCPRYTRAPRRRRWWCMRVRVRVSGARARTSRGNWVMGDLTGTIR